MYVLQAESEEDMEDWISVFQNCAESLLIQQKEGSTKVKQVVLPHFVFALPILLCFRQTAYDRVEKCTEVVLLLRWVGLGQDLVSVLWHCFRFL